MVCTFPVIENFQISFSITIINFFFVIETQFNTILGCEETDATIPNIVAPTMLGVVVCVLAVVCKWMQQLP